MKMEFENAAQLKEMAKSARRHRVTEIRIGNKLLSLPKEIRLFSNLVKLDAGYNFYKKLPPEIGDLQNLENLLLSRNCISELPPEIGKLQKLKSLNLNSNFLTSLPPEIGELRELRWLDISNNKLTELPKEISNLISLEALYLSDNPLSTLPISVVAVLREPIIKVGTKRLLLHDLKRIAESTAEELSPYLLSEVDIIRDLAKQRLAELRKEEIQ